MRAASALVLAVFAFGATPPLHAQDVRRAALLDGLRPAVRSSLTASELAAFERLPFYELDLRVADDLASYTLTETLELTNTGKAPLSKLVLRLFGNAGSAAPAIQVESGTCAPRACKLAQPRPSVIELQLKAALPPGGRTTISLVLRGQLRAIDSAQTDPLSQGLASLTSLLAGEQTSDYGLLSVGEGIASIAHFYAVLGQQKGGVWVTEEHKSFGDLGASGVSFVHATVRVPHGVSLVTSGRASLLPEASDLQGSVFTVDAGPIRDFALVASRVFQQRSRRVSDVDVRAFFLADDADGGGRVLDTAASALEVFERRFGPYPFRELDVVEAPLIGGAGGCEFSGLVTVASMLYRPLALDLGKLGLGPGFAGSPLEFTTAHEVAHQYWYGLVGSDSRTHPFQDESLTQWSAQLYFEERFGADRAQRETEAQVGMNYRVMRMLGQADAPVDRPVDAFATPIAYAGLVYGKGAYLYPALRAAVGERAFFEALQSYARQYRFQTAGPSALFDRLGETSGRAGEVRALTQRWLAQRHGDEDLASGGAGVLSALAGSGMPQLGAAPSDHGADTAQLEALLRGFLGDDAALGQQSLPDVMARLQRMLGSSPGGGALDLGAVEKLLEQLQPAPGSAPHALPPELRELMPSEPPQRGM
ncbi:MAG: M1 family aminopeptidase [Polyangiales bacterium]